MARLQQRAPSSQQPQNAAGPPATPVSPATSVIPVTRSRQKKKKSAAKTAKALRQQPTKLLQPQAPQDLKPGDSNPEATVPGTEISKAAQSNTADHSPGGALPQDLLHKLKEQLTPQATQQQAAEASSDHLHLQEQQQEQPLQLIPESVSPAAQPAMPATQAAAPSSGTDSGSDSDASSIGTSPAPDALHQLTAAMWSVFGQQPPASGAVAANSQPLPDLQLRAAQASRPLPSLAALSPGPGRNSSKHSLIRMLDVSGIAGPC